MPRGDKSSYTNKQKRKAGHIEEGYEKRGVSTKEAERRAWATVNKKEGGGKKGGSGRSRSSSGKKSSSSSRKKSSSSGRKKTTGRKK
jgi:plasmid stabilization system protein ParE